MHSKETPRLSTLQKSRCISTSEYDVRRSLFERRSDKKMLADEAMADYFKDKVILVTGGTGSIGRALVKNLLSIGVKEVRALDINENDLTLLRREVHSPLLKIFLGDIRNKKSIEDAFTDVDIVFHAAALKHVPLSEYYPIEYVNTNVIGTQNVIEASMEKNVKKFIPITTDKAVEPVNVMGATKLLAEKLTIAANLSPRNKGTIFSCVRFGNVLYTKGSVLDVFLRQIRKGKSITVTDPNMTRFIMSIKKACDLVLKAAYYARGGEIFIFKMNSVKIIDLALAFIELFAPKYNLDPSKVKIEVIGRCPGEKMQEKLMTDAEAINAIETEDMFIVYSELIKSIQPQKSGTYKGFTSNDVSLLSKEGVKRLLEEFYEFYEEV